MEDEKTASVRTGKKDFSVFELLEAPIFVTDNEGKLVYGNEAFARLVGEKRDGLEGVPVVSLIRSDTSGMQKALASGDTTPVESWAAIKDKKYFFEYRPTPTYDSKGAIRGVVETVIDRTGQKLALEAVQDLVAKAKAGELSARAEVAAEGDYKLLVDGINEMLDALINPLNVAASYVDRISKGDTPEKITEAYNGDFNTIKDNLNNCIDEIGILVDEVGVVIMLAREGNLSQRTNPDRAKGVYRKILRGINDSLDALINPLNIAANYVDRISKGDTPEKITEAYNGDFNAIKDNLNTCIDEIGILVDEVGVMIRLAREGNLSQRTNPDRAKGVYRKILRGINDSLDALINPLNVAANYVDNISKGEIPEKITVEYSGDFNNIKNNLNNCIEAINGVIKEMGGLIAAVADGDLSQFGDVEKFQGAFKEMVEGMNKVIESIGEQLRIC